MRNKIRENSNENIDDFLTNSLLNKSIRENQDLSEKHIQNKNISFLRSAKFKIFIIIGILLIAIICTFIVNKYLFVEENIKKYIEKDKINFVNHFSIKNASFTYNSAIFILNRDKNPNFDDDIIKNSSDNKESENVLCEFTRETSNIIKYTVQDLNNSNQWKIPFDLREKLTNKQKYSNEKLNLNVNNENNRYFIDLLDQDNNSKILFTTKMKYFRYMEKYISFEISIPSIHFFGLGERISNIGLLQGTYTLFPKNNKPMPETRKNPGHNQSGMHPFILCQLISEPNNFIGIYFRTSLPLEVKIIQNMPNFTDIRFTTIGGNIEFYTFFKGSPQFILKEYHNLIGKPMLPPFWAIGYIHGKSGFGNIDEVKKLVNSFKIHNIPLDGIWLDTDLLEDGKNFVLNKLNYSDFDKFVTDLHEQEKIQIIVTIKAGIKIDHLYNFYNMANEFKTLVRSNDDRRNLIGKDKYGYIAYPNFFSSKMCELWQNGVSEFYNFTHFDGIYMENNQYYNELNGDYIDNEKNKYPLDNMPYIPGNVSLNESTLSMSALYFQNNTKLYELFVHSINNILMANCTNLALQNIIQNKNKLLLSEATFPGIQKFVNAHLFTNIESNFEHLKYSLSINMNSAISGIPLCGTSICGYFNDSSEELCGNWIKVGALYPFSVNFNSENSNLQDPYGFSLQGILWYKNAIRFKYSLARAIYSCIFKASLYGETPIFPLFFEYPNDELLFRQAGNTFIYSNGILVTTPIRDEKEYSVYFPNDDFFQIPTGTWIVKKSEYPHKFGHFIQLYSDQEILNVFLKSGSIIPYQDAAKYKIKNISELQEIPGILIMALGSQKEAFGQFFVDDGISNDIIEKKQYRHYNFEYANRVLKIRKINDFPYVPNKFEYFSELQIWGAEQLKNITSVCILTYLLEKIEIKPIYNPETKLLRIPLNIGYSSINMALFEISAIIFYQNGDYNFCAPKESYYTINPKLTRDLSLFTADLVYNSQNFIYLYKIISQMINQNTMNINIKPENWTTFEVPDIIEKLPAHKIPKNFKQFNDFLFGISSYPDTFFFKITYPENFDYTILTTENQPFIFTENFIQLTIWLNSTAVFGLGERFASDFQLHPGRYTIYSYDNDNISNNTNLYGYHPFLMFKLPDNTFSAIFILNSNAMDIDINSDYAKKYIILSYLIVGGILDLHFIQRNIDKQCSLRL